MIASHSSSFMRSEQVVARDAGVVDEDGDVAEALRDVA